MIRKPHLQLIAGHSVRHGIRGGAGLISIFMTLITGLILAYVVIAPLEAFDQQKSHFADRYAELSPEQNQQLTEELNKSVIKTARKAIDWATDPSEAQLKNLTDDHPAIVSAFLILLMLFTPFLICLGGFNQTSSDIDSKGLRFLLIRTERPNIFFGRFIGTYLFTAVVFAILFVILMLYMAIKVHIHAPGEMVLWLLGGYLRIMIFALPYMALCAWISCSIESGFGSMIISMMIAYLIPGFIGFGSSISSSVHYGQYLTPWGYKYWLFQPMGLQFFAGILVMLGFTVLLLFVGSRHFAKRDL